MFVGTDWNYLEFHLGKNVCQAKTMILITISDGVIGGLRHGRFEGGNNVAPTRTLYFHVTLQLSPSEEAEGAVIYDLVVTVPHLLDARNGGNLVAHIKVGETYHQRKEVSGDHVRTSSFEYLLSSFEYLTFLFTYLVSLVGSYTPAVVPLQ